MAFTIKPISVQVATLLARGNVYLEPKPNGLFTAMAEQIAGLVDIDPREEVSTEQLVTQTNNIIKSCSENPFTVSTEDDGPILGSGLDVYPELAFNELKPMVLGLVGQIKTLVIPTVNQLFEAAYKTTSELVNTGGIKLAVKSDFSEHPFWSNDAFHHLLNGIEDTTTATPAISNGVVFPEFDDEIVGQYLQTGDNFLDSELEDLLSNYDRHEALEYAYHTAFTPFGTNNHKMQDPLLESVLTFMMARGFLIETPDGVSGVELPEFQLAMRRIFNYHGAVIKRALNQREAQLKNGGLIKWFPADGEEYNSGSAIIYLGQAWQRFEDLGGDVDLLYGAYISQERYRTIDALIENADRLRGIWASHVQYSQQTRNDQFQGAFSMQLRKEINAFANEHSLKIDGTVLADALRPRMNLTQDNVYAFARQAICHTLFPNTQYLSVLENMDSITASNPSISDDNAFELALIDTLVGWALTHVKVV